MTDELDKNMDRSFWNDNFIWPRYGILGFDGCCFIYRYHHECDVLDYEAKTQIDT